MITSSPIVRHVASAAVLATFALLAVASGGKPTKEDPGGATSTGATVPGTGATAKADPAAPLPLTNNLKFTSSSLPAPDGDLAIDAPEGAKWEEKFTNVTITAGDRFQVMVSQGNENLAEAKKAMTGPDAFLKVAKFEIETPDTLFFEGEQSGVKGYHFVHNVKAGPTAFFKCTDWRNSKTHTKADVEQMLAACKTLRGANAKAPVAEGKAGAAAKPATAPKKAK